MRATNNFKEPRHQSFNGVFLMFFADLIKRVKQNIYILALPFISGTVRDYILFFYMGLILLVLLQFIYTYLLFLKYTFYVSNTAFHLHKGLFRRREIEIPFDRIQNINLQQNFLQQVLSVVGLDIETAGESKAEVQIKALRKKDAEQLKTILLAEKEEKQVYEHSVGEDDGQDAQDFKTVETEDALVFKLCFLDLLKVGLSSNILKGLSLVFAFAAYVYNAFSDLYFQNYDAYISDQISDYTAYISGKFLLILSIGLIFIGIGFIVTAVFTVIKYFNLKVIKLNENYEVEYGLFNRFKKVLKSSKVQTLEFRTNPVRKLFGFQNAFVSQASSEETTEKHKIGLVGLPADYVSLFFKVLFKGKELDTQKFVRLRCQLFRFRVDVNRLFFVSLAFVLFFVWEKFPTYIFIILLLSSLLLVLMSYIRMKKSYLSFSDELVKIGSGIIGTQTTYLEIYKIQSIRVSQSIFQKRRNLSSFTIYTASGSLKIKYLEVDHVHELTNFLMYKIESSDHEWI
ncbi:MAG: PH domain-containing protein [Psychroflexus sp.]|nr:PH domain-containing protein [Psychroflexus sp.]